MLKAAIPEYIIRQKDPAQYVLSLTPFPFTASLAALYLIPDIWMRK